jgi:hypothetical protein
MHVDTLKTTLWPAQRFNQQTVPIQATSVMIHPNELCARSIMNRPVFYQTGRFTTGILCIAPTGTKAFMTSDSV